MAEQAVNTYERHWVEGLHTSGVWHPMYGPMRTKRKAEFVRNAVLDSVKGRAGYEACLEEYEDFKVTTQTVRSRSVAPRKPQFHTLGVQPTKAPKAKAIPKPTSKSKRPVSPDAVRIRIKVKRKKGR